MKDNSWVVTTVQMEPEKVVPLDAMTVALTAKQMAWKTAGW